jgi:hypothetical protein
VNLNCSVIEHKIGMLERNAEGARLFPLAHSGFFMLVQKIPMLNVKTKSFNQ